MRIRVEEPIHQDLLQVALKKDLGQVRAAYAGFLDALVLRDLDTRHILQRQYVRSDVGPVDPGDPHSLIPEEVDGYALSVVSLRNVVQLLAYGVRELTQNARKIDAPSDGIPPMELIDDEAEAAKVCLDDFGDLRPLDFDHHRFSPPQVGAIRLSQRGGGDHVGVKPSEDGIEGGAEIFLYHRLDLVKRHRRHLILEHRQLLDELGWQKVNAGAEELTDLDDDAAHVERGSSDPSCSPPVGLRVLDEVVRAYRDPSTGIGVEEADDEPHEQPYDADEAAPATDSRPLPCRSAHGAHRRSEPRGRECSCWALTLIWKNDLWYGNMRLLLDSEVVLACLGIMWWKRAWSTRTDESGPRVSRRLLRLDRISAALQPPVRLSS